MFADQTSVVDIHSGVGQGGWRKDDLDAGGILSDVEVPGSR